jgi:hypothetical protein
LDSAEEWIILNQTSIHFLCRKTRDFAFADISRVDDIAIVAASNKNAAAGRGNGFNYPIMPGNVRKSKES